MKGNKKMKKLIALILCITTLLALCLSLASCKKDDTQIRVGYMAGPTGIGMAKLINDNKDSAEKYEFTKYADTTSANTDLMTGKLDIACLPTNEAAKFYNTVNSDMQVLAINCLNSLCLLTNDSVEINSIEDLNGKEIVTCQNGTPRIILQKLLEAYGISATISYQVGEGDAAVTIKTPQDIAPIVVQNKADVILAPEPIVSNALSKPSAKHKVTLDLSALWAEKFDSPIAMGCIVVSKSFAEEHPKVVASFLKEYEKSIKYMASSENVDTAASYVVDAGIMGDEAVSKSALNNLGSAIAYLDGEEMKETLISIYEIFGLGVVGGKLPDDNFYYAK